MKKAGETGSLESKSGSCLQFRAVECNDETAASAEVSSITESGTKMIVDSYTDFEEGAVPEFAIPGEAQFTMSGKGKTEDGKDVTVLSAAVALTPTTILEVWVAAYPDDMAAAKAALASLRSAAAE